MGEHGDFARKYVLDQPMLQRVRAGAFQNALDIGCGEGRFCRALRGEGLTAVGIEPCSPLRETAIVRDPGGTYVDAKAEDLPFGNESFDLVVSYLTLIDIDDAEAAINEMARVLRKDGSLLIANLNSFNTAGSWKRYEDGSSAFSLDHYLTKRALWVSWRNISIRNWHRPFAFYMKLLIDAGLQLTYFDEPAPTGGDPDKSDRYRRSPYFHIMEWRKA